MYFVYVPFEKKLMVLEKTQCLRTILGALKHAIARQPSSCASVCGDLFLCAIRVTGIFL